MLEFAAVLVISFVVALPGGLMPGPFLAVTIGEPARWVPLRAAFDRGCLIKIRGVGLSGIINFFACLILMNFSRCGGVSLGIGNGRTVMRDGAHQALIRACRIFPVLFEGGRFGESFFS